MHFIMKFPAIQIAIISIILLLVVYFLTYILNHPISNILKSIKTLFSIIQTRNVLKYIVVSDLLIIFLTFLTRWKGGSISWSAPLWLLFTSILYSIAYYADEFVPWFNHRYRKIARYISMALTFLGFFMPVISFYITMQLSSLYFQKPITKYGLLLIVPILLMQLLFIIYYCSELIKIRDDKFSIKFRINFFVSMVIHITQLFANIYILILIMDKNAISYIKATTPFELSFDLTYFSIMVFLNNDGLLVPSSYLSKSVVLLETIIFPIYISVIILSMVSNNYFKNKNIDKS